MTAVANKTEEIPISEFCQTGSGGTPSRSKAARYFGGSISWVKSGELRESIITTTEETITEDGLKESAAKLLPANTLLVALYGATVGRIGILGIEAATNQAVCYIIPDERRADRRYLYYALRSKVPVWLSQRVGGGQPNISQGIIKDTKIPLPPLSEQKRIADILDKADAIRRKRQKGLFDLQNYIPALFIEMFGEPDANPKKWEVVPISHFVQGLEGGKNFKTDDKPSAETRYMILKVSAVTWGEYKAHESKPVPPAYDPPKNYFVRPDDLLMSRANTRELIGAAVYVDETPNNVILPDKIWRFVWKTPSKVEPLFVHSLLRHPSIQGEMGRRSSGTSGSMKNIAKPKVLSIPVPLPPLSLQQNFATQVRRVRQTRTKAQQLQNDTDDLFNSLVQRAFRGDL